MLTINQTPIDDLVVIDTAAIADSRGKFARYFCHNALAPVLNGKSIQQINHSQTLQVGAIRGLHCQTASNKEIKLIRCTKGRVFDVAVDIRQGSATFLHWFAQELSAENQKMMLVPEGFLHGFQVLEENSELLYLHTAPYAPECEFGARFDDQRVQIQWPLPCSQLSEKDSNLKCLPDDFCGI